MAASTTKKVEIRRFDRETLPGYVSAADYLREGGIEYLTPQGMLAVVPYDEVRLVEFVRDFSSGNGTPEESRVFLTRPKTAGLWVRLTFRDGELLEGILPNDLLSLDPHGFVLTPPGHSASQRVFVPRRAVQSVQVLGVVGSPLRSRRTRRGKEDQPRLFE